MTLRPALVLPANSRPERGRPAEAASAARRAVPAVAPPEASGNGFVLFLCLLLVLGFFAIGALAFVAFTPSPMAVPVP